ncbi:MAG: YlbF family regulator [Defluviitaleaceae bacterium]|nr:YlbF family regulator [Defluviitaleaceae bacterium]
MDDKVIGLARELAASISASDAARNRAAALAALEKSAENTALMREYSRLSDEMQFNRLKGIAPTFEDEASLSLVYSKICVTPECKNCLDAQTKYNEMLANVYGILDSSIQ